MPAEGLRALRQARRDPVETGEGRRGEGGAAAADAALLFFFRNGLSFFFFFAIFRPDIETFRLRRRFVFARPSHTRRGSSPGESRGGPR